MLEKIGLPAKPSMRGGNWVIDASHCQTCSSQFTFINRKHHCRRCGGLFCNNCTQQRMTLRGQGDAPVRICDPCKKLEEAARFELRYGHKGRTTKASGSLRLEPKLEEESLDQIAGTEVKPHSSVETKSSMISELLRATSSSSASKFSNGERELESEGIVKSISEMSSNILNEMESKSPEELRQQAAEEKKKYRILKGEGKPEEALQAFKRGKDLERQAGALEIALRKSRRKASVSGKSVSSEKINDSHEVSVVKRNIVSQSNKSVKDDLLSELRELGWSDADLRDADKKPQNLSVEGELSSIIREIPSKANNGKGSSGIDNGQVLALKRKALMLKREGKLAEAKEELKKAKLLEKQLEEQELLGQADDSDDELSALIHSMDDDKQEEQIVEYGNDIHVNFDQLSSLDNLAFDDNFDVTDADMNDPEIASALRSFGWDEEDDHVKEKDAESVPRSREEMESEVLSLKREALKQKHAGNTSEAMTLLKRAKLLEKDIKIAQPELATSHMPQKTARPSMLETDDKKIADTKDPYIKPKLKSKFLIQRELLDLKKKALVLRREGRTEEADEELKKGKELERQLQEMEDAPKPTPAKADTLKKDREVPHQEISADLGLDMDDTAEVTEEDMFDPAMLSALGSLGWVEEHPVAATSTTRLSRETNSQSMQEMGPPIVVPRVVRNKAEIQRELLGIKRKALALRRQGKMKEADEELERAKSLEKQMTEMEVQHVPEPSEIKTDVSSNLVPEQKLIHLITSDLPEDITNRSSTINPISTSEVNLLDDHNMHSKDGIPISAPPLQSDALKTMQEKGVIDKGSALSAKNTDLLDFPAGEYPSSHASIIKSTEKESGDNNVSSAIQTLPVIEADYRENCKLNRGESASAFVSADKKQEAETTLMQVPSNERNATLGFSSLNEDILAHKRKAVALKREGKLAEAREELRRAKILEKNLEEGKHEVHEASESSSGSISSSAAKPQSNSGSMPFQPSGSSGTKNQKPMAGRDRFKLQQESLAHKRQAMKLRREGRMEESDKELEMAKALEAQLEEIDNLNSGNKKGAAVDASVEALFDPQLLSALKSIGWEESDILMNSQEKPAPPTSESKNVGSSSQEPSEANSSFPKNTSIRTEKAALEEQINAEKGRALNLKRAGKQAEALEALRSAKHLEKRLAALI